MMFEIKWNVRNVLSYRYHFFSESMRYTSLIHYIWVLTSKINNNDA